VVHLLAHLDAQERMVSARQPHLDPHKEMMTTTSALYLHLDPQEEIEQRVWALEPHLDLPLHIRLQKDTGHTASAPHPHVVKEEMYHLVSAAHPDRPQKEIRKRVPALQPHLDPPEKIENSVSLQQGHLGPQRRQGFAV